MMIACKRNGGPYLLSVLLGESQLDVKETLHVALACVAQLCQQRLLLPPRHRYPRYLHPQAGQFLPYRGLFEPGHLPSAAFRRLRLRQGARLVCSSHYPALGSDFTEGNISSYLITFLFVIASPAIIKISQIADSLKRFL